MKSIVMQNTCAQSSVVVKMERVHGIACSEDNIEGCQKKAGLMSAACVALPVLGVQRGSEGRGRFGKIICIYGKCAAIAAHPANVMMA